jgi:hypothetical protein
VSLAYLRSPGPRAETIFIKSVVETIKLRWAAMRRQSYLLALATVAGALQGFLIAVFLLFVAADRWLL